MAYHATSVASEAYHDWSGEAADTQLRVNFTLELLLSQNFCNWPLMRFISFASNIGPAAAVPAGPAPAPLYLLHGYTCTYLQSSADILSAVIVIMMIMIIVLTYDADCRSSCSPGNCRRDHDHLE